MRVKTNLPPFGLVFRERLTALPTDRSRVMFALLATYADRESGDCFPKQSTLADLLGWSEGSVRRALSDLREAGVLETRPILVSGRKTQNAYCLEVAPPILDGSRSSDRSVEDDPRAPARPDSPTDRAAERDPQSRSSARSEEITDQGTDHHVELALDARSSEEQSKAPREVEKERVAAITRRYYDEFKTRTGVAPPETFIAIRGMVKAAVREGFNGPEILGAMRLLDQRGRPLLKQTLWDSMLDARGRNPRQPSTREAEAAAIARQVADPSEAAAERDLDRRWEQEIAAKASDG